MGFLMASVTLADAWIHLAADLSQSVTVNLADMPVVVSRPVETRRYAGGRVRAITRPGVKATVGVSVKLADRSTVTVLEGWIGLPVLLRDPRGRRWWGVYGSIDEPEMAGVGSDLLSFDLSLSEISWTEAV